MKPLLTTQRECIGKTIESIGRVMCEYTTLHFTDGTAILLEAEMDPAENVYLIVCTEPSAQLALHQGLIDETEYLARSAAEQQQRDEEKERREREMLRTLIIKYER